MKNHLLSVTIAACLTSCSDNSTFLSEKAPCTDRPVLQLSTRTFALHSLRWEETFRENATLNVFVVTEQAGTDRKNQSICRKTKAKAFRKADGHIQWKTDEPLPLDKRPVRVHVCYPYQSPATFSPASWRLRISPQACYTPDYQTGTLAPGHKPVNRASPYAWVGMQHLLSRLSFRLTGSKAGSDRLYWQAVQVGNCSGHTAFCQEAAVDLFTGKTTAWPAHPGATLYRLPEPMPVEKTLSPACRLGVLPLANALEEGEIEVVFTVSGKKYRYAFPRGTFWEKGYEYRYDLRLDGNRLTLIGASRTYM